MLLQSPSDALHQIMKTDDLQYICFQLSVDHKIINLNFHAVCSCKFVCNTNSDDLF